MNKKQINVLWIGIGLIVLMGLVPPWAHKLNNGAEPKAYSSIFSPPEDANEIDLTRLGIQCALVAIVAAGWIVTLKSSDSEASRLKSNKTNHVPRIAVVVPLVVCLLAGLPYGYSVCRKAQEDDARKKEENERLQKEAGEAREQQQQSRAVAARLQHAAEEEARDFAKQLPILSKPKKLGLKNLPSGLIALLETRMSEYGTVAYRLQVLRSLDPNNLIYDRFTLDFEDENGFSLAKKSFTLSPEPQLYTGTFYCGLPTYKKIANWNLERAEK